MAQVARHLKRDRSRVTRGLKEAADLGYLTNREDKPGRAARYRTGPEALPEDKPALPAEVDDDAEGGRTPAHPAHPSPQVSEGCAPVRLCAGGEGYGDDDDDGAMAAAVNTITARMPVAQTWDEPALCIGGCGKSPRRGCATCWEHASLEPTQ